jgi:TRAP-type mannitol/chloroaromatic compound transport system permease large subunit
MRLYRRRPAGCSPRVLSSIVTTAAMSRIAVPEMLRAVSSPIACDGRGYSRSGTLGSLIPPILMVLTVFHRRSVSCSLLAAIPRDLC